MTRQNLIIYTLIALCLILSMRVQQQASVIDRQTQDLRLMDAEVRGVYNTIERLKGSVKK